MWDHFLWPYDKEVCWLDGVFSDVFEPFVICQQDCQDIARSGSVQVVWLFFASFPTFSPDSSNGNIHTAADDPWNALIFRRPPTSRISREKRSEIGKSAYKRRYNGLGGLIFKILHFRKLTNIAPVSRPGPKSETHLNQPQCFRCYVSFNILVHWVQSVEQQVLNQLLVCWLFKAAF